MTFMKRCSTIFADAFELGSTQPILSDFQIRDEAAIDEGGPDARSQKLNQLNSLSGNRATLHVSIVGCSKRVFLRRVLPSAAMIEVASRKGRGSPRQRMTPFLMVPGNPRLLTRNGLPDSWRDDGWSSVRWAGFSFQCREPQPFPMGSQLRDDHGFNAYHALIYRRRAFLMGSWVRIPVWLADRSETKRLYAAVCCSSYGMHVA